MNEPISSGNTAKVQIVAVTAEESAMRVDCFLETHHLCQIEIAEIGSVPDFRDQKAAGILGEVRKERG